MAQGQDDPFQDNGLPPGTYPGESSPHSALPGSTGASWGAAAPWDPGRQRRPTNKTDPYMDLREFYEGSRLAGARYGQGRDLQMEALQRYQDILAGRGTSLAQAQLQQQSDQNAAQALAVASMGRGGNTAATAGQAGAALAGNQMATNQQAAMLRAQEEQAALAGLGGMSSQLAGQDLQAQLAFEQMMAQGKLGQLSADTQFRVGSRELNEMERQGRFDRVLGGIGAGGQVVGNIIGGIMGSDERLKENVSGVGDKLRSMLADNAAEEESKGQGGIGGLIGNLFGGSGGGSSAGASAASSFSGGGGFSFSDERAKQNVSSYRPGRDAIMYSDERAKDNVSRASDLAILAQPIPAVRELEPVEFDYKPGMGPSGRQVGVMAQDLEKTPQGAALVMRRPSDGMRMVDTNKAAMLSLAAAAAQQEEIDKLKKKVS